MHRFPEADPSNALLNPNLLTAFHPPSQTWNAILEKDSNISSETPFPDRIYSYPPTTCGSTKGKNRFSTGP